MVNLLLIYQKIVKLIVPRLNLKSVQEGELCLEHGAAQLARVRVLMPVHAKRDAESSFNDSVAVRSLNKGLPRGGK